MKPVELFLLTPGAGPWQACQEEKPEVRKASLDALVVKEFLITLEILACQGAKIFPDF